MSHNKLTLFLSRLPDFIVTCWTGDWITPSLLGDLDAMMFLVGVVSSEVAFAEQLEQCMAAHERKFCELAHDVRSECCGCDGMLAGVSVAGQR
jgi:hypothetical protein